MTDERTRDEIDDRLREMLKSDDVVPDERKMEVIRSMALDRFVETAEPPSITRRIMPFVLIPAAVAMVGVIFYAVFFIHALKQEIKPNPMIEVLNVLEADESLNGAVQVLNEFNDYRIYDHGSDAWPDDLETWDDLEENDFATLAGIMDDSLPDPIE